MWFVTIIIFNLKLSQISQWEHVQFGFCVLLTCSFPSLSDTFPVQVPLVLQLAWNPISSRYLFAFQYKVMLGNQDPGASFAHCYKGVSTWALLADRTGVCMGGGGRVRTHTFLCLFISLLSIAIKRKAWVHTNTSHFNLIPGFILVLLVTPFSDRNPWTLKYF